MAIITHFNKLKCPEFFQFNSNICIGIFALMVLGMGQKRKQLVLSILTPDYSRNQPFYPKARFDEAYAFMVMHIMTIRNYTNG